MGEKFLRAKPSSIISPEADVTDWSSITSSSTSGHVRSRSPAMAALHTNHMLDTELTIAQADLYDDSLTEINQSDFPFYSTCPQTGKKKFHCVMNDFQEFDHDASKISVKLCGRRLVVCTSQSEADGRRNTTNEVRRSIRIPRDVDIDQMRCIRRHGNVEIEAPVIDLDELNPSVITTQQHDTPPSRVPVTRVRLKSLTTEVPLNTPYVTKVANGQETEERLEVIVEVGHVFRADDITIRVKNRQVPGEQTQHQQMLIVSAHREQQNGDGDGVGCGGRLSATLLREIDLPLTILPHTTHAHFTRDDGLLRVNARINSTLTSSAKTANRITPFFSTAKH